MGIVVAAPERAAANGGRGTELRRFAPEPAPPDDEKNEGP